MGNTINRLEETLSYIQYACILIIAICLSSLFFLSYILPQVSPKPPKMPNFLSMQAPKLLTFWKAKSLKTHFILTTYADSQEQNRFHNEVLNQRIQTKDFTYLKLYVINFGNDSITFHDQENKIQAEDSEGQKYQTQPLSFYLGKQNLAPENIFYLETFSQKSTLEKNHLQMFLVAFPFDATDKKWTQIYIRWSNEWVKFDKEQTLRNDFHHFLENPEESFFTKS